MPRKTMVEVLEEIQKLSTNAGNAAPGWNKRTMSDLCIAVTRAYAVLSGAQSFRLEVTRQRVESWSNALFISDDVFEVNKATGVITALIDMTVEVDVNMDADVGGSGSRLGYLEVMWTDMPYSAYKTRVDAKGSDDIFTVAGAKFDLRAGEEIWLEMWGDRSMDCTMANTTFTASYIPRTWPPGEGPANKRIPPS